jgi:hypothetical protein
LSDINIEREKIIPFMKTLFGGGHNLDHSVLELAFASFLRFYDKFVEDITKEPRGKYKDPMNHPYVASVQRARLLSRISKQYHWGDVILVVQPLLEVPLSVSGHSYRRCHCVFLCVVAGFEILVL